MSKYHQSYTKLCLDIVTSSFVLMISLPFFVVVSLVIIFTSGFPVFFVQKRVGKNGKIFGLIKFRSMRVGAEKELSGLKSRNEVDGPVFKIKQDPRFTTIGRLLSKTGLDELPQILNVLKGEMSIVGPRPLPIYEEKRLTEDQRVRDKVKPGITSTWVVNGSHEMSFKKWMELDADYVREATFLGDLKIIYGTILLVLGFIFNL